MSILIIAEKPSVAKDISKVLDATKKGDGFLYNKDYIVSWAIGHLVTLQDPEDYSKDLKKWAMKTLPIIPSEIKLKPVENTKKQLEILINLINNDKVESLICATDSGREGELIFRYIYNISNSNKPFKRLWISSMTDTAIKKGFETLKDGIEYDNLYESAKCRSEADWLVGINATRAYTVQYNTVLSIGRVQTPTLAIIVNRQREIDEFNVESYFEVKAYFDGYTGRWINQSNESKIVDEDTAKIILNACKDKIGEVKSITNETKQLPPPLLFDLTELQRECNKRFGFSAKKTLQVTQDLYEKKKYVTYPRTDSRYLSNDMVSGLKNVIKKLEIEPYTEHSKYLLGLSKLPITKRIVDDSKITDHHAIIPTLTNFNLKNLSPDESKVFDLIARRFLSVFFPKHEYSSTTLITKIEDNDFISRGTTIIKMGWKDINLEVTKKNEEEELLPLVKKGDKINVKEVIIEKKKTKPPSQYTEGQLLSAMENAGKFVEDESLKEHLKESGIGTPATRAAIIERLLDVGYIVRNKKNLVPTEKGCKLIQILPTELTSPETTGRWEKGLTLINKGDMDSKKFMSSIQRYVSYIITSSKEKKKDVKFPIDPNKSQPKITQNPLGKCTCCEDGLILENTKGFYCSNWQNGCKFTIWKNGLNYLNKGISTEISNKMVEKLLAKNKIDKIELMENNINVMYDITLNTNINGFIELYKH